MNLHNVLVKFWEAASDVGNGGSGLIGDLKIILFM